MNQRLRILVQIYILYSVSVCVVWCTVHLQLYRNLRCLIVHIIRLDG